MGVSKTKKNLLFSIPGSSWFIYTPTKKINILKLKTPNQNIQKSQQNPHFCQSTSKKSQYRTQYRKTPTKSTLSPISHPKSQPTIQITFFLYKYKILRKIHIFTDHQLFTKFTYKSTSNFSYLTSKIIILYNNHTPTFLTWNH